MTALLIVALSGPTATDLGAAQAVPAAEREELVRLRVERGGRAEEVDALLRQTDEAAAKGLPAAPLTNKIREGLAKGHPPNRIEPVIRQMAAHLETADTLLRELATVDAASRVAAVTLLAEALGGGVTQDEVRELGRLAQPSSGGGPPVAAETLAGAAKGLSFIKDARLPVTEGSAVLAEASRRGFRPYEILDVGREVKRRETDFQAGRFSLRALRDAIARGDRPDQLFRDGRPEPVNRIAPPRPEAVPARPAAPARPEPLRPEPAPRPDRPATGR